MVGRQRHPLVRQLPRDGAVPHHVLGGGGAGSMGQRVATQTLKKTQQHKKKAKNMAKKWGKLQKMQFLLLSWLGVLEQLSRFYNFGIC